MDFWKEHMTLRALLIAVFFIVGLVLVVVGWKMPGQLSGLGLMLVGVVGLLTALFLYNKPYQTPSRKD